MHKISEKKVKEIIKDLKKYKKLDNKKHNRQYYYDAKRAVVDSETLSSELVKEFLDTYNDCRKSNKGLITESIETDDRAETGVERDDNGNIQYYTFEIYRKNTPALIGKLTRNDMEVIMKLYSFYGANLTQKIVSREFPMYTFVEFKRIIRAFNIYKSNSEFPLHMIEEHSEEELLTLHNQNKENNLLRKLEKDQLSEANKLINKLVKENQDLKEDTINKQNIVKDLINTKFFSKEIKIQNTSSNSDLIIVLSDLHVGAYNEKNGYIELEDYNEAEIIRRLDKILTSINNGIEYNSITVCNLGDSVDSYNKQTTRGGHELPSIISNKEQSKLYLKIMLEFFNKLILICPKIKYICVGESNHDGDWGWLNNIVLAEKLRNLNIDSYISDDPIDTFDVNGVSVIYLHGKDNFTQFKNFPLTLDFKTESWFNSYFIDCGKLLQNKKCIIKGDLHQYAYTCAKHFDYISAPSLYGSSNWITSNFGKTPWGALVIEIDVFNNIKNNLIRD